MEYTLKEEQIKLLVHLLGPMTDSDLKEKINENYFSSNAEKLKLIRMIEEGELQQLYFEMHDLTYY